jgi:hypothetical protein
MQDVFQDILAPEQSSLQKLLKKKQNHALRVAEDLPATARRSFPAPLSAAPADANH